MGRRNVLKTLLSTAVITNLFCGSKPATPPPYLDIEEFYKTLGHLWIIATATATGQASTACKFYDVTSVKDGKVYFGRIFYRNGTRVEKQLTGILTGEKHPVVAQLMKYNNVMRVQPSDENLFEERLLYQSRGRECGVFNVRSISHGVQVSSEFFELRLWNSSAVSPYKECLKAYAERVPNGKVITTYYNPLCKNILTT
ncbi:uncharacterized protein LOC125946890 isoform X1 [Dermacentor silvarum]|uniref:uncharacterized protein LOC125946890 isoform X1 n=1 Tax=Dermacentor silvarum TaxID=543639 RepID=UPI00210146F6|nr:uncharacterized protein LOC125946890 isoform X1 [Dermacentor silvarum]